MTLRFRQLQAFHSIIELGTVTKAAGHLGISQPGISNLIAQLERQTDLKLFERRAGRLVATPDADVLFREVDTVVRGLDHVQHAVTDLQNKQAGQLQVATAHMLSFGFMPDLIAQFVGKRPNLTVSFQSNYSTKVQEWVIAGLFEIGVSELPVLHASLEARQYTFELELAMHRDNPLARHTVLTPELLAEEPFVVMGPAHMTYQRTLAAFQAAEIPWKTKIHTHLFENILAFVKQGLGVALLDPFTVGFNKSSDYITRPFRPAIFIDLAIVRSRHRPLSVVGDAFYQQLTDEISSYATHSLTGAAAS